jgi:hypothetical protein
MELFHTPQTSPHPLLETFENLSPKPSSHPSLSLFDTIAEMETQQQPMFQPNESLDDAPHPSSLLESLAYRYTRTSIFPNDQGYTHLQSFVFHPIYKDLHGNPSGEPSLQHFVQQQQPQQQKPPHFTNEKPRSLLDQNESFDHNQPPQQEYHHPKPLLFHPINKDIHGPLTNEMRFILNHILDRLKFRVSKMKQNRFF